MKRSFKDMKRSVRFQENDQGKEGTTAKATSSKDNVKVTPQ